ncbi:hypothetical protein J6590_001855 [Homalodisca vitripennis]|nr:hypothetical protein J6590_001855 [Homalodisca vitripennis]
MTVERDVPILMQSTCLHDGGGGGRESRHVSSKLFKRIQFTPTATQQHNIFHNFNEFSLVLKSKTLLISIWDSSTKKAHIEGIVKRFEPKKIVCGY